ncbi:MAG: NUDIX domain-containing protein [Candidatus Moraniibacteriota bacterium]|nr:MAG: NUDIX domain-containing protein [Candidatus Moranbacteria bacterium]
MRLPVNRPLYQFLTWCGVSTAWEVSVGAILFRVGAQGREYLLLEYPSGHFDFAKGHVEAGEKESMTLKRETKEETGIEPLEILDHRMTIRYFYIAKGNEAQKRKEAGRGLWIFKLVHFYPALAASEAEVKLSHEHTGFVWLPYREAVAKATFDNAKNLIVETEKTLTAAD